MKKVTLMFYDRNHHPAVLRERFPQHLWPQSGDPKREDEAWTLITFTRSAGLRLDGAPVNLRGESRPDLECSVGGQRVFVEVAEIVDQRLAKASFIQNRGACSYPEHAALKRILQNKLSKQYVVEDRVPFHLLLYYDIHRPWGPFDFLLEWEAELARLVERSQFDRIWIFDRRFDLVLGSLQRTAAGIRLTSYQEIFFSQMLRTDTLHGAPSISMPTMPGLLFDESGSSSM